MISRPAFQAVPSTGLVKWHEQAQHVVTISSVHSCTSSGPSMPRADCSIGIGNNVSQDAEELNMLQGYGLEERPQ